MNEDIQNHDLKEIKLLHYRYVVSALWAMTLPVSSFKIISLKSKDAGKRKQMEAYNKKRKQMEVYIKKRKRMEV